MGCTYIAKSDGGCITTAKQAHRPHNACVANYLSKWTDAPCVNLLKLDVFARFYFKKLCLMLLPITEKITCRDDVLVGTSSNSVSPSKLTKIKATAMGNIFALLPAEEPIGLLP